MISHHAPVVLLTIMNTETHRSCTISCKTIVRGYHKRLRTKSHEMYHVLLQTWTQVTLSLRTKWREYLDRLLYFSRRLDIARVWILWQELWYMFIKMKYWLFSICICCLRNMRWRICTNLEYLSYILRISLSITLSKIIFLIWARISEW